MRVVLFRNYNWAGETFCRIATDETFASMKPKLIQSLQACPTADVRYAFLQQVKASKSPYTSLSGISPSHVVNRLCHSLDDEKTARFYGLNDDDHCLVVVDPLTHDFDGFPHYLFGQPVVEIVNVTAKCRYISETGQRSVAQFDFDCHPDTTVEDLRKLVWETVSRSHIAKYLIAEDKYLLVSQCPEVDKILVLNRVRDQDRTMLSDLHVLGCASPENKKKLLLALVINPETTVNCYVVHKSHPHNQASISIKVSDTASELYQHVAKLLGTQPHQVVIEAIPVESILRRTEDDRFVVNKFSVPNSDDKLCTTGLIRDCYIVASTLTDSAMAGSPIQTSETATPLDEHSRILKYFIAAYPFYGRPNPALFSALDRFWMFSSYYTVLPTGETILNPHLVAHAEQYGLQNEVASWQDSIKRKKILLADSSNAVAQNIAIEAKEETAWLEKEAALEYEAYTESKKQQVSDLDLEHIRFCTDEAARKISLLTDIQELTECRNKYTKAAERIRDGLKESSPNVVASIYDVAPAIVSQWRRGYLPGGVLLTLDELSPARVEKAIADVKEKTQLLANIKTYKESQQALEALGRKITGDAKTLKINIDQWLEFSHKTFVTPVWAAELFAENGLKKLEERHPTKVLPDIWWDVLVNQAPAEEQLKVYAKLKANGWSVPRIDNA